jgi:hypothetical protein
VFQELKRYLTSPLVMVATEAGEPLLLYNVPTSEAMSMVLVTERSDPHSPHELGSSSADGSGSQDLGPVEKPGTVVAARSQSPEAAAAPMTRQSWSPGLQRSHQTQRIRSSLGPLQWK